MTIPIEFLAFALVMLLALIGLVYLGLRIIANTGRYTITVHRKALIKEAIQFALLIALFGVIDANSTPGSFFYPVWHWVEGAFTVIGTVCLILGIAYLFLPNMSGKQVVEGYNSLPILNSFRITHRKQREH